MITIKKDNFSDQCNVCLRRGSDVKAVSFYPKNNTGGNTVLLCHTCMKNLKTLLDRELG